MPVRLKLSDPKTLYRDADVAKVLIPGFEGDLLVLPRRAPTSVLLREGLLKVFDEHDKLLDTFFIKGGIADICEDVCAVLTDKAVEAKCIDVEAIKEKIELMPLQEYKDFYQSILDNLEKLNG